MKTIFSKERSIHVIAIDENADKLHFLRECLTKVPDYQVQFEGYQSMDDALPVVLGLEKSDEAILFYRITRESNVEIFTQDEIYQPIILILDHCGIPSPWKENARFMDYLHYEEIKPEVLRPLLRIASIRAAMERDRREREELKSHLFHADRLVSLGQLAAGIAHEINNPGAFILTNLTVLEQHIDSLQKAFRTIQRAVQDRDQEKALSSISLALQESDMENVLNDCHDIVSENIDGIKRIHTIAKDLRTFSRTDQEECEGIQINEVIDTACNMVFNQIRHRARLVKDLQYVPVLFGNRARLTQVVMNLLINAAQAIEEGHYERNRIRIATFSNSENDEIFITIEDTGCGIPEDKIGKIFEPFYTSKGKDQGTGLGLSLCRDILQTYDASIEVESEVSKGTKFTLKFPVKNRFYDVEHPEEARQNDTERQVSKKRILIIDDDVAILNAYKRILSPPHEVFSVGSGTKALEFLQKRKNIDVILCDIMMPEMDGISFFHQVEEKCPEILPKIIFCSGAGYSPRIKKFLERIENPFFEKPVADSVLREAVISI